MARRLTSRAALAAALVAATIAGLLGAWFVSGWHEVRAQEAEVRAVPAAAAAARGADLARELRGELASLAQREQDRPYFHYQSLFHDPGLTNAAPGVAPTPLAAGPDDPLVLGYFEIDAHRRVTTPTINDDEPELSEPQHLAENRAFRARVSSDLSRALVEAEPVAVAVATTNDLALPQMQMPVQQMAPTPKTKVVKLDPNIYAQNAAPTKIYKAQKKLSKLSADDFDDDPPPTPVAHPRAPAQVRTPAPAPLASSAPASVTITVSPLAWRTLPFAGAPALVAVRRVQTPDGARQQGFVVDRARLTGWLASRAGGAVAELRADDTAGGPTEIAPGWRLDVAPSATDVAAADAEAAAVARAFVVRFVAIGALAALAGALAVLLVVRAERLARERSQFAAAAAHELRTPLAGLQLYGDMLADGLGDPAKQADYARRMSEEAARLGRVVSNVLGFSQLERGNLSVDPRSADLDAALCDLAQRAEPALDRGGCALALDVEPGLHARFDRDALARILGNLLDNAEKYSRSSEDRTITLSAHRTSTPSAIEIIISDHGPGVAAPARARLFRPFSRGVPSDGPAGLGLGLALSRSLARAMGGDLAYRAAPTGVGGASFVLTLAA